jgi:hypothetical protein
MRRLYALVMVVVTLVASGLIVPPRRLVARDDR